jgi:hypothetical protein
VELLGFDPAKHTVVADIAALLRETNVEVNTPGTQPGCMSSPADPECARVLPALGLPFGNSPSRGQSFFRSE